MNKRTIDWTLEDADGKFIERHLTRYNAREAKRWYLDNMFEDWQLVFKPPLKIVREEWELVDKKVVR